MSGYWFKNGQTGAIVRFKLNDSSQTSPNNKGITGLSSTSTGLIIATMCDVEATAIAYTQAGSTIQTIATLGTYAAPSAGDCRFQQIDATNFPGWYEFQFLNARFAVSNAKFLGICVPAVSGLNLAQQDLVIPLTDMDPYSRAWQFQATAAENYSTAGSQGTPEQILNDIHQFLMQSTITGTAWAVFKQNGSTQAMGLTTNNASNPTSVARTS